MPNSDSKRLTNKQIYWLKHLREAKAGGRPFAAYARSQGLRPAQLHTWSSRLQALGVWESSAVDLKKRATKSLGQNAERSRPTQPGFVAARVAGDLTSPFTNGCAPATSRWLVPTRSAGSSSTAAFPRRIFNAQCGAGSSACFGLASGKPSYPGFSSTTRSPKTTVA